ncbi:hypothetical protein IIY67_02435 [Candidatus Saccharibacteria bacterium]|nr:hypothetical protein [Candidatus Saccharibacteria bacterium]
MLMVGSKFIGMPVLSLQLGGATATVKRVIIDPENLSIIAFELSGSLVQSPEFGNYLLASNVRDADLNGLVIDSADVFVDAEDVVRLKEVLALNFNLVGLRVVAKEEKHLKKIGKVVDFTVDQNTFSVFQLIAQRPLMSSFMDPQLTINRSQITEVDDYKITIRHEKQKVKVPKKNEVEEEFVPNFTNPFRKPNYSPAENETEDRASITSE